MSNRKYSDDLRNVVKKLRQPAVTMLDQAPADERCCICLRDFDTPIDPSDKEKPCSPMKFHTCGHLIGDTCYKTLPPFQQDHCLMCTRKVTHVTPVPKLLTFLCKLDHFGHFSPVGLLADAPRLALWWPYFRRIDAPPPGVWVVGKPLSDMQVQLFGGGVLTKREAVRLWTTHVAVMFGYLDMIGLSLAMSYNLRYVVRTVFEDLLSVAGIDVGSLPIPTFCTYLFTGLLGMMGGMAATLLFIWKNNDELAPIIERDVPLYVAALLMLLESFLTAQAKQVNEVAGFWGAAVFLTLPFVVYAFIYALLAGWLIYYGWRYRKPIFA